MVDRTAASADGPASVILIALDLHGEGLVAYLLETGDTQIENPIGGKDDTEIIDQTLFPRTILSSRP